MASGSAENGVPCFRGRNRAETESGHPKELPGSIKVTEDSGLFEKTGRGRKGSEGLGGRGFGFQKGGGTLFKRQREVMGERAGLFCETQTSGLNIDPWQTRGQIMTG